MRAGGEAHKTDQAHPAQIVRKLREAERLLAEGTDLDEVCRRLEVSVQTYQRWKAQYHGIRPQEIAHLKDLQKENARLKKIVAEQALGIDIFKEVSRGNW